MGSNSSTNSKTASSSPELEVPKAVGSTPHGFSIPSTWDKIKVTTGGQVTKNKRKEGIYAQKQERWPSLSWLCLPLVISMFFCLLVHFSLPRVSCLNPLPWESHLVLGFYSTPAHHLGRTTCADVIEMIENFPGRDRLGGDGGRWKRQVWGKKYNEAKWDF